MSKANSMAISVHNVLLPSILRLYLSFFLFQAALGAWLDSESSYRLTVEKAKEATDGADYARQQFEKYNTAYLDAKKTLDEINKQNAEERSGLMDERDLIKQIMVMIGARKPKCSRMPHFLS